MDVEVLPLSGVLLCKPRVFRDERGFFLESWHEGRYRQAGMDVPFVQDNHSWSSQGTLRGLHYQSAPGQAKLVRVVRGCIWDVAVDLRVDSPTLGQWVARALDADSHHQLFIPVGFAHGFVVLSEVAEVLYKVSAPYDGNTECGLAWDDPDLAIDWPVKAPLLSERDLGNESFASWKQRQIQ